MINTKPENRILDKYEELKEYLRSLGSVVVAFSSGVDSTFLLYAAKEALGESVMAVTASSYLFPERELDEATDYCKNQGIKHRIIKVDELKIAGFSENPKNRCYICKKDLFERILEIAKSEGYNEVIEGSNLDDNGDYRPGLVAVSELGIKSPLRQIGFSKDEIRTLSNYFDLPTWNKPSFACLASRFPYGNEISKEKLEMVDKAEQYLLNLGFHQLRVRIHDNVARIEITPEEFEKLMEEKLRKDIYTRFKDIGFDYVTLDLMGYRTGSMNETLKDEEKK